MFVGDSGFFLVTINGGNFWEKKVFPSGKNLKEIITGDIVLIRKVLKKLGIKQKGSKLRKGTTLAFSGYESMWNRLVTQKAKEILKKKRLVFC